MQQLLYIYFLEIAELGEVKVALKDHNGLSRPDHWTETDGWSTANNHLNEATEVKRTAIVDKLFDTRSVCAHLAAASGSTFRELVPCW